MTTNINQLSDDCLRLILAECPLNHLIASRAVCIRWHTIISLICSERHSLKLFESYHDLTRITRILRVHNLENHGDFKPTNDRLIISPDCTNKFLTPESLPKLFPKVIKLLIGNMPQLYKSNVLPLMLEKWSNSLESLSLNMLLSTEQLCQNFWPILNSITTLKRLNFVHLNRCGQLPESIPILGQLEGFALVHYRGDAVPILAQLTSPNFTNIRLSWIYFTATQLKTLLEMNPQFCRIQRLTMEMISSSSNRENNFRQLFELVCDRFEKLKFLDLLFADHLPLSVLIPQLSKLKNLQELWLYLDNRQLAQQHDAPSLDNEFDCASSLLYYSSSSSCSSSSSSSSNSSSFTQYPQIRSIKTLYLDVFNLSMEQFFGHIPAIFPNIEALTIKCNDCFSQVTTQSCEPSNNIQTPVKNDFKVEFVNKLKQQFRNLQSYKLQLE